MDPHQRGDPSIMFEGCKFWLSNSEGSEEKRIADLILDHGGSVHDDIEEADYLLLGQINSSKRKFTLSLPRQDSSSTSSTTEDIIERYGYIENNRKESVQDETKTLYSKDWITTCIQHGYEVNVKPFEIYGLRQPTPSRPPPSRPPAPSAPTRDRARSPPPRPPRPPPSGPTRDRPEARPEAGPRTHVPHVPNPVNDGRTSGSSITAFQPRPSSGNTKSRTHPSLSQSQPTQPAPTTARLVPIAPHYNPSADPRVQPKAPEPHLASISEAVAPSPLASPSSVAPPPWMELPPQPPQPPPPPPPADPPALPSTMADPKSPKKTAESPSWTVWPTCPASASTSSGKSNSSLSVHLPRFFDTPSPPQNKPKRLNTPVSSLSSDIAHIRTNLSPFGPKVISDPPPLLAATGMQGPQAQTAQTASPSSRVSLSSLEPLKSVTEQKSGQHIPDRPSTKQSLTEMDRGLKIDIPHLPRSLRKVAPSKPAETVSLESNGDGGTVILYEPPKKVNPAPRFVPISTPIHSPVRKDVGSSTSSSSKKPMENIAQPPNAEETTAPPSRADTNRFSEKIFRDTESTSSNSTLQPSTTHVASELGTAKNVARVDEADIDLVDGDGASSPEVRSTKVLHARRPEVPPDSSTSPAESATPANETVTARLASSAPLSRDSPVSPTISSIPSVISVSSTSRAEAHPPTPSSSILVSHVSRPSKRGRSASPRPATVQKKAKRPARGQRKRSASPKRRRKRKSPTTSEDPLPITPNGAEHAEGYNMISELEPYFVRFGIPFAFHVACSPIIRKKMEIFITGLGGGEITPIDQATFIILANPPGCYDVDDSEEIRTAWTATRSWKSRIAVSQLWVEECVNKDAMIDPRAYQITFMVPDPSTPHSEADVVSLDSGSQRSGDDSHEEEDQMTEEDGSGSEPESVDMEHGRHCENDDLLDFESGEEDQLDDNIDIEVKSDNEVKVEPLDEDCMRQGRASRSGNAAGSTSSARLGVKITPVLDRDKEDYEYLRDAIRQDFLPNMEESGMGMKSFLRGLDAKGQTHLTCRTLWTKYRSVYAVDFPEIPYTPVTAMKS